MPVAASERAFEKLYKAKYQIFLGKLTKTIFVDDFDSTVKKLAIFQADTATYPTRENLIVLNGRKKTLCFTQSIFKPRDPSVQGRFSPIGYNTIAANTWPKRLAWIPSPKNGQSLPNTEQRLTTLRIDTD